MTAGCVSRDPVLDDFFDRIPEQYRPVMRDPGLDMAIYIVLSRHPTPSNSLAMPFRKLSSLEVQVALDIEGILISSYSSKNF